MSLDQVERVAIEAMSNLRSKSTGVDGAILWVSAGEFEGSHEPRVKVILGQSRVTMEALKKAPTIKIKDGSLIHGRIKGSLLKKIRMFLDLNRVVLLNYWNEKIDSVQMAHEIKKI